MYTILNFASNFYRHFSLACFVFNEFNQADDPFDNFDLDNEAFTLG
jgi:hypothetical protein